MELNYRILALGFKNNLTHNSRSVAVRLVLVAERPAVLAADPPHPVHPLLHQGPVLRHVDIEQHRLGPGCGGSTGLAIVRPAMFFNVLVLWSGQVWSLVKGGFNVSLRWTEIST